MPRTRQRSPSPAGSPGLLPPVTELAAGVPGLPEDTEKPSIEARLIPPDLPDIPLGFTIRDGDTRTYHGDAIPTGYHTLTVKLLDNGMLTMGAVEVVRIVRDQLTSGPFEFFEINKGEGAIQVNVKPDMRRPIEVTLSGLVDEIRADECMRVSASVPKSVGKVNYVWDVNGGSRDTATDVFEICGYAPGIYRLDVTAFTFSAPQSHAIAVLATHASALDGEAIMPPLFRAALSRRAGWQCRWAFLLLSSIPVFQSPQDADIHARLLRARRETRDVAMDGDAAARASAPLERRESPGGSVAAGRRYGSRQVVVELWDDDPAFSHFVYLPCFKVEVVPPG